MKQFIKQHKIIFLAVLLLIFVIGSIACVNYLAQKEYAEQMDKLGQLESLDAEYTFISIKSYNTSPTITINTNQEPLTISSETREQLINLLHTVEYQGIVRNRNFLRDFVLSDSKRYSIVFNCNEDGFVPIYVQFFISEDDNLNMIDGKPYIAVKKNPELLEFLDGLFTN